MLQVIFLGVLWLTSVISALVLWPQRRGAQVEVLKGLGFEKPTFLIIRLAKAHLTLKHVRNMHCGTRVSVTHQTLIRVS